MLRRLIGEDVQLITELAPDVVQVKADQGQIEQVIMNLAVNARDAMPQGGKLELRTSNFVIDETFARRYPYPVEVGQYLLLTVADTGIGMDLATRARIFEPFFTTKEKGKGTGLGLSTVYGVVKQSGGYIDVVSEPGAGTSFKIYLPQAKAAEAPRTTSASITSLTGNETILLVEDEASLRKLSRDLLERSGYSVIEAESGEEALSITEQYTGRIDLLLTDVVMPGISGRVLADELLNRRTEVKVVYMSGYTGQTVGAHGVLAEGSLFLPKPFTREALAAKVREALDAKLAAAGVNQ